MRAHRKHLDFEINLIPCIDLLSVCICFLLLTAVWLQIGSINVKQAIGGQSQAETDKAPQLWVTMGTAGELNLNVKGATRGNKLASQRIKGRDGRSNLAELAAFITGLRNAEPALKAVLIQPRPQSDYEEIIDLMDEFKRAGLADLGVVPL